MPRTDQEVNQLIGQLKARRNAMDQSADAAAVAARTNAVKLESEAVALDGQIAALRQSIDFLRDPKDNAGRQADVDQIRTLLSQAEAKRRQAGKETTNADRKVSLKHAAEATADREICVHCVADIDDNGDIRGASHYRISIEDVDIKDSRGTTIRTAKGLRSLFRDDEADIDLTDRRLRIGGKRVGEEL